MPCSCAFFLRHWPGIAKNSPGSLYRSRKWWPVPREKATFLTMTGDYVSECYGGKMAQMSDLQDYRVPFPLVRPFFSCSSTPIHPHCFWLQTTFEHAVSSLAGSLNSMKRYCGDVLFMI